jgi:predicted metal-dependent peptidase
MQKQTNRIKKAHVALMRSPHTALYSGVMLMGTSEVTDGNFTAYTDGKNKRYSKSFLESIKDDAQVRGIVLHENLHVALKHMQRGVGMWKENAKLANQAADYVVNSIIIGIQNKDSNLIELPDGGLYDKQFENWSMREVYDYLKQNQDENEQSGGGGSLDEHDFEASQELTDEQIKDLAQAIDNALREGGLLAGRMGGEVPRVIGDMLEPKVNWREALREFVSNATKGVEEMTWAKMNKRYLVNDMYLPSMYSETVGELIIAIDTSGSIGGVELTEFASEVSGVCNTVEPEQVRVIWWDAQVHGEQIFRPSEYNNIASLLKPLGGGGTHVSCVNKYIEDKKLSAEAIIVLTDGYVEHNVDWTTSIPTLWMVTQNKSFNPPAGKKVFIHRD